MLRSVPPRSRQPPPPQAPALTPEHINASIARLKRRIADLQAFDPATVQKRWPPEVEALEAGIEDALAFAFGHDTPEYRRYQRATTLDHGPVHMVIDYPTGHGGHRDDLAEARHYLAEGKQAALLLLQQAVRSLEETLADREAAQPAGARAAVAAAAAASTAGAPPRRVFVVHGHDDATKETVAGFIRRLGLEPVILHEQTSRGRTLITKLREEAADVGFAVVVMTPDDVGKATDAAEHKPRARQNVVFELGFFIGTLQPARVAALVSGGIELPSDYQGVVYIPVDGGNWRGPLAKELLAAGFEFDARLAL
jgi:predicted nucleotide-binding protein